MTPIAREFLALIERNIRLEYQAGANTRLSYPNSTGWRVMPVLVVSHLTYSAIIERSGREVAHLRPHQTFVVPPGIMHCATMISRRPGNSHWSHLHCEIFHGVSIFDLAEPPVVIGGKPSLRLREINDRLAEIATAEPSLNHLLQRQSLGLELISILLQTATFKENRINLVRHASRLTPVLAYIQENLAQPIDHGLLARKAGLSPSRFHVLFHSALGVAPYAYVQKLRLKQAQQLLIRTDRTVAEIGQDVGHPDPYHFSRIFRRNFGISPAGYRKQMIPHTL